MQDNAPGHGAIATIEELNTRGLRPIFWPPNSPDLNPIEQIWNWMKDYIDKKCPTIHSSYQRVRQAVIEAWNSIPDKEVKDLIRKMKDRCEAVIEAGGWHTKY
jgi:transposase